MACPPRDDKGRIISKKKTEKMQEAYDNDEVESAEDFLRKFAKSK